MAKSDDVVDAAGDYDDDDDDDTGRISPGSAALRRWWKCQHDALSDVT